MTTPGVYCIYTKFCRCQSLWLSSGTHTILLTTSHCACIFISMFEANSSFENIMWPKLIAERERENYVLLIDWASFYICSITWCFERFNSMSSARREVAIFIFLFTIYIILGKIFPFQRFWGSLILLLLVRKMRSNSINEFNFGRNDIDTHATCKSMYLTEWINKNEEYLLDFVQKL